MLNRRRFLGSLGGAAGALIPAHYTNAESSPSECNGREPLSDGRRLGYTQYGVGPIPILYFHGIPSSRIEARLMACCHGEDQDNDDAVKELLRGKCRIISIDRPGIGRSDYLSGRSILAWASDVKEFVDRRKIDDFSVIGVSGGTPFALACAQDNELKKRIRAVAIVSGHAPPDADHVKTGSLDGIMFRISRHPRLARLVFQRLRRNPRKALWRFTSGSSKPDRDLANDPRFRRGFIETYCEATRCGARGIVRDIALLASPWCLRLSDIKVACHVFHGGMDRVCPIEHADFLAKSLRIPIPRQHFEGLEKWGHFTTVLRARVEIMQTLIQSGWT